ncbi:LOW QUALITY PROTEIN: WD repeat-containing protein 75 [Erpetoichthys calabaricus]|uniref:LOW QUALITY PROTEIN: WD repeat-containing protein 75 n=1 Tax=Erpetoichthys calabaricus TaxID=27687 RepID=UPI00223440F2|nr:LOW QUALITY PROTEIN: WD repeat-containing protein 75 [Erpetoichthys calabaricus]
MVESGAVRVVRCGGSRIHYRKALFSVDSRFLLCAAGNRVQVLSTQSQECLHILEGHSSLVSGLVLNPANHLQLYSCSVDGTIKLWDFTDGLLMKTFHTRYKLLALYASAAHPGVLFGKIPVNNEEASGLFQLVALRLPKSSRQEEDIAELSCVLMDVSPSPGATCFSSRGEYIASVKDLSLLVYFFSSQKAFSFSLKATDKKEVNNVFTCVDCHPKEDCIATGHMDGKIRLWRNFNQKKMYTYCTMHWPHSAVNDLAFTPEGEVECLGGVESVLVQWRYDEPQKRDFLPRPGGAIELVAVSPDGSLLCTSHSDNKLTIIHSSLKVASVIQGLIRGGTVRAGLNFDPRSRALVMNGRHGHLQFYCLERDQQLYSLDIVQQEIIDECGLQQFEVAHVAFDAKGAWLATVEERTGKRSDVELCLKLWAYDESSQSFTLNTTVMTPHDDHVVALCFCPGSGTPMLVTAGSDGCFKAWVLGPIRMRKVGPKPGWSCDFVGTYHGLSPATCCFSQDGSILAVAFEQIVTVWSPLSWELLATICQPPGHIRELCFGRQSCARYLLGSTSANLLCCWDLLTCTCKFSTLAVLKGDPWSEYVAAFTHAADVTDLFVFKPSEPRPTYVHREVCRGQVLHAISHPPRLRGGTPAPGSARSCLYLLQKTLELGAARRRSRMSWRRVLHAAAAGGHGRPGGVCLARPQPPQSSVAVRELLQTPAHILPAATFLCALFINSLLISRVTIGGGAPPPGPLTVSVANQVPAAGKTRRRRPPFEGRVGGGREAFRQGGQRE